jgi:hypothetical protein
MESDCKRCVHLKRDKENEVMRKTNGFALAVVLLLLAPGCKPDTPPPQPEEAPAEIRQDVADTQSDVEAPEEVAEEVADTQSDVEPSAREAAERFLKALKIIDSPEGKKTLAETRWRQTMKFPEYQEVALLHEEMFSTDIPGVKGYKQVAKLAIPREGGRPFVKRYVLIAYEDTKEKTWKVFDFTDVVDTEGEAERTCEEKALAEGEATACQGRLLRCSYWRMMAGKFEQAKEMAKKANELYAKNSNPDDESRYYKARADATIDMIARMSGAQL